MSLPALTLFEVRPGGSDTANGGFFSPTVTLVADLTATDANTSSPVVSSVSYNFDTVDVGNYLFIQKGTNWLPGWYPIVSVSGGNATINAAVGAVIIFQNNIPYGFNTVVGCATVASPTAGSWTVDYSQQDAAPISITGATTSGANANLLTSSATQAMRGNAVLITGGTNFITGVYSVSSVTAGTSIQLSSNCATAAASGGTAVIGGGFASLGGVAAAVPSGSISGTVFLPYNGGTPWVASTGTINTPGGCPSFTSTTSIQGYDTSRYVGNNDANRPTFQVGSGVASAVLITGNAMAFVSNLILDGNNQTSTRGTGHRGTNFNVKYINFTAGACVANQNDVLLNCEITACSGTEASCTLAAFVDVHDNTNSGLLINLAGYHINSYNNTGASSNGLNLSGRLYIGLNAYNNGQDGFVSLTGNDTMALINSNSESNGRWGYNFIASAYCTMMLNNSDFNNTSGRLNPITAGAVNFLIDVKPISPSASVFNNPASGDFSLNSITGAGLLVKGIGFPSIFPAQTTSNFPDVGAAQHKDAKSVIQIVKSQSWDYYE